MEAFEREQLINEVIDKLAQKTSHALTLETAFSQSLLPSAIVGLDGSWIEVNRALCVMLGYEEEELKKMTWQDVTHPNYLDMDSQLVQDCIEGYRDGYKLKKKYIGKNGSEVLGYLFVSLIEHDNSRFFVSQIFYYDLLSQIFYYDLLESEPCKNGNH